MIHSHLLLQYAKEVLEIEIKEAQNMLMRLNESIIIACRILLQCKGKVIVSGIGKSGCIGRKIAASLASTGTPAFFMHPTEALHGDLGMVGNQDVVIFISYSGHSTEIISVLPFLIENNIPVITLTGNLCSPVAIKSNCVLDVKAEREACPMKLAPTSSTVNALMMGDALTISLMRYKGFSIEQFSRFHPGGKLGAQLLNCVQHIMRIEDNVAKVFQTVTVMDAMFELSRTGLGLTAVCDNNFCVVGVFTDGDLRRWIIQGKSLTDPIEMAMTQPGYCVTPELRASVALQMLHKLKITAAPVVNKNGLLVGLINVHDLHRFVVAE